MGVMVVWKSLLVCLVGAEIFPPTHCYPCLLRGSGLARLGLQLWCNALRPDSPGLQEATGIHIVRTQVRCQGCQGGRGHLLSQLSPGEETPTQHPPRVGWVFSLPTPDDSLEVTAMQQTECTDPGFTMQYVQKCLDTLQSSSSTE